MPAQVAEEIQLAPDRLAGKQLFQRGKQQLLGRRLRRVAAFRRRGGGQWQRLQRLAVDLAALQTRHGGKRLKVRGHHVGRQLLGQAGAQGRRGRWRIAAGHHEGHQLFEPLVLAQQHGRGAHARLRGQHGLDLAQLDAKASNLDLVVGAAQALHLRRAVGRHLHPRQIAGAVQARLGRVARPGVGQEFLGRQIGPAQVAGGHAGAGDAQLAGFAKGQQLQRRWHTRCLRVGIDRLDHHQPVVGQCLADGDRLAGVQLGQAGRHRGLGRPIGVEQLAAGPRPLLGQRLRAGFAAQVDQAQAGHVLREQRQQGGHGVQHADVVLDQRARQRLGVAGDLLGADPQRGADQVADPDLLEAHVESDRKALIHPVVLAHAQAFVLAAQEVADAGLGDGDALGLAGGAAGVDDVGGVLGPGALAPPQRRAGRQRIKRGLRHHHGNGNDLRRLPRLRQQLLSQ